MNKIKYIRHSTLGFVIFPQHMQLIHSDVAMSIIDMIGGKVISAGFVSMESGKPVCFGRSESLGLAAGLYDSEDLQKEWGIFEGAKK